MRDRQQGRGLRAMIAACLALAGSACSPPPRSEADPWYSEPPYSSVAAQNADPFIGTAGEGFTFPGAVAPWGMVSVSPHNTYSTPLTYLAGESIAPAGYVAGTPGLYGFGHTQLSGVGCPDLGAPVVAVTTGAVQPDPEKYRAAAIDHEVAWPGHYGVHLDPADIWVQATATQRVGVSRIRFPASAETANVLIDAGSSLSWIRGQGSIRVVSASEVEGSSATGLFCVSANRQNIYFVARLDRPADSTGTWKELKLSSGASQSGQQVGAYFTFRTEIERPVQLAVGVSYVSIANARANLDRELGGRSFEEVRRATFDAWDKVLSRVKVKGGSKAEQTIFYTALYHMLLHPNVLHDVNGQYPVMGRGRTATLASGQERYTVFSLWDTYRNLHPFLTLVFPEKQAAMLRSLAAMIAESGRPPRWELAGSETDQMVGDPVIAVLADSAVKGLGAKIYDLSAVYAVLRRAALDVDPNTAHRPGNASYLGLGYIPMEEAKAVWGPVSTTLEYAHADWAMSQLAGQLGKADDAALFRARSASYARLYDSQTGLLRPRNKDGSWIAPFCPDAIEGSRAQARAGGPGYVEGTAHHYAFFVPHDVPGLAALHGGETAFVDALQRVFDTNRFTLWNEPDIAYPYLFTHFKKEAWRTDKEVRRAFRSAFTTGRDGLPGNDDAGTLSAWVVFSAMGLYPDCPGSARYSLTTPLFERVEIQLSPTYHAGRTFVIRAPRTAAEQIYMSSVTLNGRALDEPALTHGQITAGGTLDLTLSDTH